MSTNTNSFPLASVLTIVFVVLKLSGVITWSWWWVFSPMWISAALALSIALLSLVLFSIIQLVNRFKADKYSNDDED
jgi:membrane protein YdbS with pleckstrin-like domain